MSIESGQTTIEYVLVILLIAFVIVIALSDSEVSNSVFRGGEYIANRVTELVTP